MLTLATIFLLSIGGAVSGSCRMRNRETCEMMDDFAPRFPETKAELDSICRGVIKYFKCLSGVYKQCGEDDQEAAYARTVLFYFETRLCNELSHIYEALSNNIRCLKDSLPDAQEVCSGERQRKISSALEDYLLQSVANHTEYGGFDNCIDALYAAACLSVTLGQACGEAVGDAVLDVFVNVEYFVLGCPQQVVKQMPYVMNALHLLAEAEGDAENAFERK